MDALTPAKRPTPTPAPAQLTPVPLLVPAAQHPPPPPTTLEEVDNNEEHLIHPFTRVKDTVYALPTTNNVGAKPKPLPPKKPDVPLRTAAPVYDPQVASTMYVHTIDSQITITQHELLLLSPEVRNQVREATSNQCIIRTGTLPAPVDQNLLDVFMHIEVTDNEDDCAQCEASCLAAIPATYSTVVHSPTMKTLTPTWSNTEPLPGAIIIEDLYKVYLCTTLEDCSPDCLTITKESSALRTILPLINHNQFIESVLDPSSQVIAMLEAVCHVLALIYDPHIHLCMQLANASSRTRLLLTPPTKKILLQTHQMATKTEDSLVFCWEGRHIPFVSFYFGHLS